MTTTAISSELKTFARQKWPLANDKFRKDRLAGILGFTKRRIKSFWEGETTARPRDDETSAIERLIGKRIGAAAEQELEDGKAEYRSAAQIAAGLWALVNSAEADFYGPQVAAFRAALLGEGPAARGRGSRAGARTQGRDQDVGTAGD